jgi:putative transcriptional regulator
MRPMTDGAGSLVGNLLIAMPTLVDPNFWRSVVLLGVHSHDEGAFGLVVNRPLDVELADILRELGEEGPAGPAPVVLGGGPVEPTHGFVLFERGEAALGEGSLAIGDLVEVSGSTEVLSSLVRGRVKARYYLLLGYSGWAPGQLEREIEENSWLVAPLDPTILFDVPIEERWAAALRSIGVEPGNLVDAGSAVPS